MSFHENEPILDGRGNRLMPATPISQKHCFLKNALKISQILENSKIFLHFLLQFYRAFQWYIVCFHTLNGLGCADQNVNQEIKGCISFFRRLYMQLITQTSKSNGPIAVFRCKMAFLKSKFKDDPVRVQRHTVPHFKGLE